MAPAANRFSRNILASESNLRISSFKVSLFGFDNLLRLFVGEATVGLDNRMHNTRVLYLTLVCHFKDSRVGQFLVQGRREQMKLHKPFGKHRNGTVYEIDGGGAFLGFFVDDAAFRYVVRHVGNVYAHFPKIVLQFADRQGVVKVLSVFGVYGKGGYIAEILTFGIFFCGNFGRYLVCGFFHGCGVNIRQSEFGQDGVHLGGVISGFPQNVDNLTDGILCLVGPFYHFDDGLVSRLSTFQFLFGE